MAENIWIPAMSAEARTDGAMGLCEPPSRHPIAKSTTHLIQRAVSRLVRAGGRETEGDAAHLLEGIAVVVYDPDTAELHPTLPAAGSGLRWDEFIETLVAAYESRFEADEEIAVQAEGDDEADEDESDDGGDGNPGKDTPRG